MDIGQIHSLVSSKASLKYCGCNWFMVFKFTKSGQRVGSCEIRIRYKYRAYQILCAATDGCRSRPWLVGRLADKRFRILTLVPNTHCYFSSVSLVNLIQCFFCKNMTSSVDFSVLYGTCFFQSINLFPNWTEIRHRSSWKLYSKFASCFRTRLCAFFIRILNVSEVHTMRIPV